MFTLGRALATSTIVLLGLTACSSGATPSEGSPDQGQPVAEAPPAPPTIPSLRDAQQDIVWPAGLTLSAPDGLDIDSLEINSSCAGEVLHVILRLADATESDVETYLQAMQDEFAIPAENRAGHGQGSIRDSAGLLREDSVLENAVYPNESSKAIQWRRAETGGYQVTLREQMLPGKLTATHTTPQTEWTDFPRPDVAFDSCIQRESIAYRADFGMTPPSATWTLTAPQSAQPQIRDWMKSLAASGWTSDGGESGPHPGDERVILTSEDYTAQYLIGQEEITLFINDRTVDKLLGF